MGMGKGSRTLVDADHRCNIEKEVPSKIKPFTRENLTGEDHADAVFTWCISKQPLRFTALRQVLLHFILFSVNPRFRDRKMALENQRARSCIYIPVEIHIVSLGLHQVHGDSSSTVFLF